MSTLPAARLHHPTRLTAGSIYLGVERDTRGVGLRPEQRLELSSGLAFSRFIVDFSWATA